MLKISILKTVNIVKNRGFVYGRRAYSDEKEKMRECLNGKSMENMLKKELEKMNESLRRIDDGITLLALLLWFNTAILSIKR